MFEERREVRLMLNGTPTTLDVAARRTLADAIREDAGLTGTHLGCEHGVCGACTVLLDGEPVRSCLVLAVQADGLTVETVESLGSDGGLDALQRAFSEHRALQCGFCTPGFLMSLEPLLADARDFAERDIREALAGNLCRCTGYQNIVAAVRLAAQRMAGAGAQPDVAPEETD